MDPLLIAVAGLLIIVACQFVAPKVGVASPLILLVVGLAIGFLPQVGAIEIEPNIILEMVLPPLLFSAAVRMPTMDFRREMQAVAMLAIPLVFLSAFAVGFVINWLVPAISLPWGVALGAVLSPTDAVAVSIAKRSGVSHRIITVLEGEGLFNDATSLVMLSAAMSAGLAADEHALNPGLLIGKVAIALGIAAGIGWVVGEVGVRLRALIKEPSADTVFSFAMPFIASIPAEHLGGSGLVAAVVAGLVVSRRRAATISAANRRFSQQNWQTMTLVLESGIFLTMGLQAFGIVEETAAFSGGLAFAAFLAVTLGALIMVIRAVFIALMFTWLDHRHKRRQRRYEAEAARIERFEKRMHKASEVDADMLQARDLSPERWEDALNHYRRRLKRRARRNAMRGSDLDYFESEPLGPREGSVIVWARAPQRDARIRPGLLRERTAGPARGQCHRLGGHARRDHPGRCADDLDACADARVPAHDRPVHRCWCARHPGPDPARTHSHRQAQDGHGRYLRGGARQAPEGHGLRAGRHGARPGDPLGLRDDITAKGVEFKVPAPTTPEPSMMRTAKQALTEPPIPEWATNNEPTRQSEIVKQRLAYIKPGENAFNATDMPEELRLNVRGAKLSQIYKRLDPNKPAYTVTGSGGGGTHIYHWEEPRALTNRERARLQTFPDWYKFIGSKENVRRQIGMAVPPDGAQVIFEALFKTLEGIPYDNIEGDHYESIEPNIDIEKRIYKLEEKELEEKENTLF